tara:strand:- start:130 stop:339 length:210 start_codon:yes stop_codon:yes gene_type:complete
MTKIHPFKLSLMNKKIDNLEQETTNLVDKAELNLWKRGFTPQAEIWNGRMATVGICFLLLFITLFNKVS